MCILVHLRHEWKAVKPTDQNKPEKVNSLLTSGEDVLISDVHIIKNGTPGIA